MGEAAGTRIPINGALQQIQRALQQAPENHPSRQSLQEARDQLLGARSMARELQPTNVRAKGLAEAIGHKEHHIAQQQLRVLQLEQQLFDTQRQLDDARAGLATKQGELAQLRAQLSTVASASGTTQTKPTTPEEHRDILMASFNAFASDMQARHPDAADQVLAMRTALSNLTADCIKARVTVPTGPSQVPSTVPNVQASPTQEATNTQTVFDFTQHGGLPDVASPAAWETTGLTNMLEEEMRSRSSRDGHEEDTIEMPASAQQGG